MNLPKIVISCNPVRTDDFSGFAAVINVADDPCQNFRINVPNYWFPIHETGIWGYSPFYGAAKVVDQYGDQDKPILIHCHAGANRSPSVTYAVLASNGATTKYLDENFKLYGPGGLQEIYERNIKKGCIFPDTIAMLKARHNYNSFCIHGLLSEIASPNLFNPNFKRMDLKIDGIGFSKTYNPNYGK